MFKRRRFPVEITPGVRSVVLQVRHQLPDLVEMMQERGVEVDPSTIMRWVHRYAPELEKRVRWHHGYRATSWRVDETYVKVGGRWKYLFRAVDKHGRLIDFMLADRRNTRSAHRFLGKALKIMPLAAALNHYRPTRLLPSSDLPPAAGRQTVCRYRTLDLQISEQHHRSRPWRPQASHSTDTRLPNYEDGIRDHQGLRSHAMIRRGHCLTCKPHAKDEVRFINKLFDIFAVAA